MNAPSANTSLAQNWQDDDIDLRALLTSLWARRLWILASMLVVTALTVTAAFLMTPIYRATTTLVPTGQERSNLSGTLGSALGSVGGLASLAGINLSSGDTATQEALAVLRSREFTERFIVDLNLMPKLFAGQWDATQGKWKDPAADQPTRAKAFQYFAARIRTIDEDQKTGLVTVAIEWRDPREAASWTNELVERLNAEMRARAIRNSEASVAFLEKELASTMVVGTREAISRLIETQIRQRMLANVTHEFAFRVADRALPADADDPVKPKKLLMFLAGPVLGFAFGAAAVWLFDWLRGGTRRP